MPQSAIDIGIAGYALPGDNTVAAVLGMPFRKQRDYWQDANGNDVPESQGTGKRTLLIE